MSDTLILLETDIKRCEDVLKGNNYLEIVIAIEELLDKYKGDTYDIGVASDNVWSYTKKDLEDIKANLISYRDEFIKEYNQYAIDREKINLEKVFSNTIDEIKINEQICKDKKEEVLAIVNNIKKISDEEISINEKWLSISNYMVYLSEEDINISTIIINLINCILQNK